MNETTCPKLKNHIIAGECAEHNGGVSYTATYFDGFWYLDALGTLASLGHSILARQCFARASYGLLDNDYNPNADYFTGLLFHNLMSEKALGVTSDDEYFRVYAHCARDQDNTMKNGVAMAFVNINDDSVMVEFDNGEIALDDVYFYELSAYNATAGLLSTTMALNGVELKLDENGKLPDMSGKKVDLTNGISVAPKTYGFFLFAETSTTACA